MTNNNDDYSFQEQVGKWEEAVRLKIDSEIVKHDEDEDAHDELFAQKSTVSFTRALNSGTKIGSITIDDVTTDLYCETDTDTTYTNATTSKAGLMSASDKEKLNGIADSADNVTMDATLQTGTKLGTIYINGVGTDLYCETNTDTVYTDATQSQHGLMSSNDKKKLDGITDSADAVSFTRSLATGTKIGTLTINGVGTDLYCETDTDTVYVHPTYTARTGKPTENQTPAFGGTATVSQITSDGTGHVTAATDRTIKIPDTEATTTTHGLMSASDKTKLNGIDTGANKYTHPSYTARTGKPTDNQTPAFGGTATVSQITSDNTGHVTAANDKTIKIPDTEATTSTKGLMTTDQVTKLNGIATGATKNTVSNSLSDTSTTNALSAAQGMALNDEITKIKNGTTDLSGVHRHTYGQIDTTNVSGNIDFNDYKTKGQYYIWYADQQNNTNKPTTSGGFLVVDLIPNGVSQTFYCYGLNNNQVYYRSYYKSGTTEGWNNWIRIDGQDKITNGTGTVTSTNIADKTIVNGDIADGTIESGKIKDGTIVNADIADNAAIAYAKLSGVCSSTDSRLSDSRTPKFNQIIATASNIQDLNNYRTGGFYYCSSDANNAPYIIHCPWSNGTATPYTGNRSFFLLVETWGTTSTYIKQTLTYYNGNNTYCRTCSAGTWGNWKEFNTNNNDYLRLATRIISGEAIAANCIIGGCTDSKYYKIVSGKVLDTKYPILFNTSAITSGSYTDNTYASHTGVPLTNNVSGITTVTSQKQVYIEGTAYDGRQFTVSSRVFVSDDKLDSFADMGKYYIYIGASYSTTNIRFNSFHQTVYVMTRNGLAPVGDNVHNPHTLVKSDAGTAGYFKFLTIRTTGTYHDHTIEFDVTHRGNKPKTVCSFNFNTYAKVSGSTDYYLNLQAFYYHGHPTPIYYIQTNDGIRDATFDFYIRRETWDEMAVSDLRTSFDNYNAMIITWKNEFTETLPSGTTQATINPYYKDTNTTYTADNSTLELSGTQFKVKDSGITSAKIADGAIVNADINANAAIAYSKLSGVAASSHTHKNLQKTEITSGSLDTVTTTGWYSYSTANSNNITNVPEKLGSMMEVLDDYGNGAYVIQKVYVLEADKIPRVYCREKYDTSGWGNWRRIANWGEVPLTLAQGTTSAFTASISSVPEYYHGLTIHILNWKGNNAANATLAINGLAAKPIIYNYRNIQENEWLYGYVGTFVYAGSEWSAFNGGNGAWLLIDPNNNSDPKFNHIGATSSSTKDLNNYKTGGFYYCDSNANEAPYISNCPLTSTNNKAFFLLVETWGITSPYVKQTLTYYHNNETYVRTCDYNTWKEWRKVDTNGDYQSPNLLPNTKSFSEPAPSGSSINGEYNGCKVRYLKNTTSSYIDFNWVIPQELLKPNTYYTLSFWAKTTTAHQNCIAYFYNGSNQTTLRQWSNSTVSGANTPVTSVNDGNTTFALTTGWKRYTVTWLLNSTAISAYKNVTIRLMPNTSANPDIYLAGVKFEEGATQTAYSEYESENLGAECVWSTHSSSTSAWTGTCVTTKSIKKGTVIYYALRQAPTTSNVTLTLTMPNGKTHVGNVYLGYGGARLTNQYPQYTMIGMVWDGSNWNCINSFKDTTYTAGTGLNLSGTSFSVKLNQQTNSTSTTEAATPSAVKAAYDLANGKANATHTHHDTDIDLEGTPLVGSVSTIDTALYEEFNPNRLAYLPVGNITIKYSTNNADAGATSGWTDYGADNTSKWKLVSWNDTSSYPNFVAGKKADASTDASTNNRLQIILDMGNITSTASSSLYLSAQKLLIYFSTNGAGAPKVQIDVAPYNNQSTYTTVGTYSLGGWSGWNSIPFKKTLGGYAFGSGSISNNDHVRYIRLTFYNTGTAKNFYVKGLKIFGGTGWVYPSTFAKNGHMYVPDASQNVTFPAGIWATKFVKSGVNNTNILLANGNDIAQSTFATAHSHPYLVNNADASTSYYLTAKGFKVSGAASGTFLKADGTVAAANNYSHPTNLPVLSENIYKITTNNNGHITAGTPIQSYGGTNLLPDTREFGDLNRDTGNSTLTADYYRGARVRQVNATSASGNIDIGWNNTPVKGTYTFGDYYTFSFWAKGSGTIYVYFYGASSTHIPAKPIRYTSGGTPASDYGDGSCSFTLTSSWKRYFVTWHLKTNEGSTSTQKYIWMRVAKGGNSYFAGPMLEKGEIPHDWSPSPEDGVWQVMNQTLNGSTIISSLEINKEQRLAHYFYRGNYTFTDNNQVPIDGIDQEYAPRGAAVMGIAHYGNFNQIVYWSIERTGAVNARVNVSSSTSKFLSIEATWRYGDSEINKNLL